MSRLFATEAKAGSSKCVRASGVRSSHQWSRSKGLALLLGLRGTDAHSRAGSPREAFEVSVVVCVSPDLSGQVRGLPMRSGARVDALEEGQESGAGMRAPRASPG